MLEPLDNPLGPKVLPMSYVRRVTYVSGPDHLGSPQAEATEPPAMQTSSQNHIRAASVAYAEMRRATTLFNWTDIGSENVGRRRI